MCITMHLLWSLLVLLEVVQAVHHPLLNTRGYVEDRVCSGTKGRMSKHHNKLRHYQNLRERYTNCTYVEGNLEITWIDDDHLDLSFLSQIREVTGYVLISYVDVKRLVLPSLQIIRGRTLFSVNTDERDFALMVAKCSKMETLEMPALRDILRGSAGLFDNYNLCHIKTINWTEIMSDKRAGFTYHYNITEIERDCPPCDKSCDAGCWGEGPENCQQFSKINCSPQCADGRCFGPNPRECCHSSCAGGCTGPSPSDCLACRDFFYNGECRQVCPPVKKYNPTTYSWEINPNGTYAYGSMCVKECPKHLLKDNGACVRNCPDGHEADDKGTCVPCDGPCPKQCPGVQVVHAKNIDGFKGCTVIQGSLSIMEHSFNGFQDVLDNYTLGEKIPSMDPGALEVFSTLKEITGFLSIQASHKNFTHLSAFRNLVGIGGRELTELQSSLLILKTSLKTLQLRSLRTIRAGSVTILENDKLCLADSIAWRKLMATGHVQVKSNKNPRQCDSEGSLCNRLCQNGCWGSSPDDCFDCKGFRFGLRCVESCDPAVGLYKVGSGVCAHCDPECLGECLGPGPSNCTQCRHFQDPHGVCVEHCPENTYQSPTKTCLPCHPICQGGCYGPGDTIREDGCISCAKAIISDGAVTKCLREHESCPDRFYSEYVAPQEKGMLQPLANKFICRSCHPRCKKCTSYGFHLTVCQECVRYRTKEQCEDKCPKDHYADDRNGLCLPCAEECSGGCSGPLSTQCRSCRNYRIYLEDLSDDFSALISMSSSKYLNGTGLAHVAVPPFNCTAICPEDHPYKIFPENSDNPYCARESDRRELVGDTRQVPAILGTVIGVVLVIVFIVVVLGWRMWHRARTKSQTIEMAKTMTADFPDDPIQPTDAKPNLSKLRVFARTELRQGPALGQGAFGIVYKGVWVPEGENVKIPVAIKVLREGTNSRENFLYEAYIMATVDHPNLLQLLGVCVSSPIMLVTPLMPLGCLLDYVRKEKHSVGSKAMLNWSLQIARGMAYLEDHHLVHRDLAARNVLVQKPQLVKITDFGLAKLLETDEDEYKAEGGKMPIKWLALECIQHRVFTHKSDVWAFGVTVWEVMTYGGKPYENLQAREVPSFLETGQRLPQPEICTIELYMILLNCWVLSADDRPTFKELVQKFSKLSRDPGRYLVVEGDKLMRLPTYTVKDQRDWLQSLIHIDGAEVPLVDAETYLSPRKMRNGVEGEDLAESGDELDAGAVGFDPATAKRWQQPQRGHTQSQLTTTSFIDPPLSSQSPFSPALPPYNGASPTSRYPPTRLPPPPGSRTYSAVSNRRSRVGIAVDENDYLVPSNHNAHQHQPPASANYPITANSLPHALNRPPNYYMHGPPHSAGPTTGGPGAPRFQFPPVKLRSGTMSLDNPEYHMLMKEAFQASTPSSPLAYPPPSAPPIPQPPNRNARSSWASNNPWANAAPSSIESDYQQHTGLPTPVELLRGSTEALAPKSSMSLPPVVIASPPPILAQRSATASTSGSGGMNGFSSSNSKHSVPQHYYNDIERSSLLLNNNKALTNNELRQPLNRPAPSSGNGRNETDV